MTFVTRNVQLKLVRPISFLTTRVEHQQMSVSRLATSSNPTAGSDILPYASIPSPPKHFILGHIPLLKKNITQMHKLHSELKKEYGDVVKLHMPGGGDQVWCYNPDDFKTILKNEGKMPYTPTMARNTYYRKFVRRDLFPHPGLSSQNEEWLDFRTKVNPDMMKKKCMMPYLNDMEIIANDLIDAFEREKDVDGRICIKTNGGLLQRWSLESVGFIFLGNRLGTLKENVEENSDGMMLIKHVDDSFDEMAKIMLFPPIWKYISVPYYKRFDKAIEGINKICFKHIDATLDKKDSGDHILLSKLDDKFGNDRGMVSVMALDAISGGIHSTASTAAFLLYLLASNPDKQELLYQEILATVGPTGHITEHAINKMSYLNRCFRESQRLKPVNFGMPRRNQCDMTLGGYHIPKGTFVVMATSIAGRDGRLYHTKDAFLPERWDHSNRDEKYHPFGFMPFGHGPRTCIGKRIAEGEVSVLIAKVIQKYRLEYEGDEIGLITTVVNKPNKDLVLKLVNRK